MSYSAEISGESLSTLDDDACRDQQACGIWGRSWGPSSPTHSLHAVHPSTTNTPNQALSSPNNFSTPQSMRAIGNTRLQHSGALLNPQDWEAALEEEIEDVGILGEGAPSPSNSDLGRLP